MMLREEYFLDTIGFVVVVGVGCVDDGKNHDNKKKDTDDNNVLMKIEGRQ